MARRNPPNRVNNIPYMLYLSEEQMKFIREQSKKEGKSQAEYCRGLVTSAMAQVEIVNKRLDTFTYAGRYEVQNQQNPLAHQSERLVKSVTHGQVCDTMKTGEE